MSENWPEPEPVVRLAGCWRSSASSTTEVAATRISAPRSAALPTKCSPTRSGAPSATAWSPAVVDPNRVETAAHNKLTNLACPFDEPFRALACWAKQQWADVETARRSPSDQNDLMKTERHLADRYLSQLSLRCRLARARRRLPLKWWPALSYPRTVPSRDTLDQRMYRLITHHRPKGVNT